MARECVHGPVYQLPAPPFHFPSDAHSAAWDSLVWLGWVLGLGAAVPACRAACGEQGCPGGAGPSQHTAYPPLRLQPFSSF